MRCSRMFGGLLITLLVAASAVAQSAQTTTATVRQPMADVRSGPSDAPDHYATNHLLQGDRVEIVQEESGGWLAVKPPPGSFSWINKRFLRPLGTGTRVWAVESEADVEVLYGSQLRKEKPSVRSTRVQRGTQVVSIGDAMIADDGQWLPIKPPPAEVRYIRATDVTRDVVAAANPSAPLGADTSNARATNWNRNPVPLVPPPSADRSDPVPQKAVNPKWAEAERAQREGRTQDAINLYDQLGREVANTDHELAMRCYNQAAALRRGQTYAGETRLRPVATGNVTGYTPQTCCVPCPANEYTFRGRLREAYQWFDHKPTFALENSQGQIVAYVTSAGASLEPNLHRVVEVSGPACWSGYFRHNYVQATRVTPLQ